MSLWRTIKTLAGCTGELNLLSDRTRRVMHGTFGDEYRTVLLEYDAAFSIGKYSVFEFLRLSFEMWNVRLCHSIKLAELYLER